MINNNNQIPDHLRRIIVSGPIGEDMSVSFLEQITALECMDISKPISVYINTYGGNVDSALCMYDALKMCTCPIITVGIGKVISAGVLLLAAGDKGTRYITKNTRVMIHEISAEAFGSVSDMKQTVDEIKRMQEQYVNLLASDSGKNKDRVLKDMEKTVFMTAEEAIKYGIADKIVPSRKAVKAKKTVAKKKVGSKKKVAKKVTKTKA